MVDYKPVLNITFSNENRIVIHLLSLEDLDKVESDHRYVITDEMIVDGKAQHHYFVFKDNYVYRYTSSIQ